MKIRSIFVMTLIVMFVSNVFGKNYINEQYGVSFILPDDWKVIEYEDLSPEKQQRLEKNYKQSQTLAICGIKRPDRWNRTTVIIQYQDFKEMGFRDATRELKSEHGKKMMISLAKLLALDTVGGRLESYRIVKSDSDFDNDRSMAFGKVYYYNPDKSDFVAMVSKILLEDGMVTLQSFSFGTEVENFEGTIGEIIDSFEFDDDGEPKGIFDAAPQEAKELGDMSNPATLKQVTKWIGWILTILIVGGIAKKIFFD
ncbi:MAG: inositol polyphosphate kinase family protein [Planctomycetes bacterium]|nr:inositol polyphosphate kinase family protein [Planctomycetota bacterium]